MFGMGFFEILLVAIIAIIALGPDKLPTAMVEVARFFKKFKSGIDEAKSTLDNELQLSDMKEEASKFKAQIDNVKSTVRLENLDLGVNDILNEESKPAPTPTEQPVQEKVSFKKKEKPSENSEKFKVSKPKKEGEEA